jgi:NAD+-dependent secondary alcohol dehydrogenase Adh1
VFGAGGLGHIGVQLLKAMTAAKVVVVDPAPAARELATSVGADLTLDGDTAVEGVLEATGGRGADVVLDFVGESGTPGVAIEIVRQGGTYLIVGYGGELQVPTMLLILKEVTIIGNLVGSYGDLSELLALVAAGHVALHTVRYDLEAAPEALDDLDGGRIHGRAVLIPNRR